MHFRTMSLSTSPESFDALNLSIGGLKARIRRMNETPEQRERRLEQNRMYARRRRENESVEEREYRKAYGCWRAKVRRDKEKYSSRVEQQQKLVAYAKQVAKSSLLHDDLVMFYLCKKICKYYGGDPSILDRIGLERSVKSISEPVIKVEVDLEYNSNSNGFETESLMFSEHCEPRITSQSSVPSTTCSTFNPVLYSTHRPIHSNNILPAINSGAATEPLGEFGAYVVNEFKKLHFEHNKKMLKQLIHDNIQRVVEIDREEFKNNLVAQTYSQ